MFKALRLWSSDFTTPFQEALKLAVRDLILAIPSIAILFLPKFGIVEKSLVGAILYRFLNSLDKYLFEASKNRGQRPGEVVGGISPI